MFERDWVKYAALGLGALAVSLVIAAYHIGSEIGETRGERNYHTSSYERHAADEIRNTCLSGQSADVAKCIAEVINATNEHQRSEYDLVAQTEMATWAFWMLIATVVMAGITLVGVIFVWFTFKDARRIGEAEVRAYIDVTTATVNASSQKISVVLTIENQGATPAHNVKIRMGWTTEEDDLSSQAPIFEEFNIGKTSA